MTGKILIAAFITLHSYFSAIPANTLCSVLKVRFIKLRQFE